MGYVISYDELYSIEQEASSKCNEWMDALQGLPEIVQSLKETDDIKGELADSIKHYLDEIHLVILSGIGAVIERYKTGFFLYRDGYREKVDGGLHTYINEEELVNIKNYYTNIYCTIGGADGINDQIGSILSSISDLIELNSPPISSVEASIEKIINHCNELDKSITEYEDAHKNSDFADIDNTISSLISLIDNQMGSKRVSVRNYQPGLVTAMTDWNMLADSMQEIQNYLTSNESCLVEAMAREEQMLADLKEERQWAKWLAAGICVIGSVALIVVTAGGATPLVCAAVGAGAGLVSAAANNFADNYVEKGDFVEGMDWTKFGKDCVIGAATGAITGLLGSTAVGSAIKKPVEKATLNIAKGVLKSGSEGLISFAFDVGDAIISGKSFNEVTNIAVDSVENMSKDILLDMAADAASGAVGGMFDSHYVDKNFGQSLFSETMENLAEKEAKMGTSIFWHWGSGMVEGKNGVEILNNIERDMREGFQGFVKDEVETAFSSAFDTIIDDNLGKSDSFAGKLGNTAAKTVNNTLFSTGSTFASGLTEQAMKGESFDARKFWEEDLSGGIEVAKTAVNTIGKETVDEIYRDKKFENTLVKHDYDNDGKVEVVTFKNFDGYSVLKEDYDAAKKVAGGVGYEGKRAQDILGIPRNISLSDDNVEMHKYKISSLEKPNYSGKGATNAVKVQHK